MNPKTKKRLKRIVIGGVVFATFVTVAIMFTQKAIDVISQDTFVDEHRSDDLDEYALETEEVFKQAGSWMDEDVQIVIHRMTHQKVESTQKWGAIQMTSKRIEILSAIVDDRGRHLEHYDVYRSILDKWLDGDFSEVDDHHNIIWELQGGSVGKATGVFSAERERKFIENVFGK